MTDRRFDFSYARVSSVISGETEPPLAEDSRVTVPVVDVLESPGGARERQLLYNDALEVLDIREGWAFARARAVGFVGYVAANAITRDEELPIPDHWVAARMTHAYRAPDLKSKEVMALSMGTTLSPLERENSFVRTEAGWVPEQHLTGTIEGDPVAVAERLLGTDYLWGGNSAFGIDCSGLVSLAFIMCGELTMQDSDLQRLHDGTAIDDGSIRRGDLWFWEGHVAIVASDTRLIHANAHHMAVVHEDIETALARIGPTVARKRVIPPRG